MGSFFRGDFGQYFTPRPIVQFIVDVLPITHESYVLDTSCGSGGFLLHALDKVRKQADEYYPGEDGREDQAETARHKDHWHNFAEKNLFGIEINEQIARTAKMNMIIHDDGHTNVVAKDGPRSTYTVRKKHRIKDSRKPTSISSSPTRLLVPPSNKPRKLTSINIDSRLVMSIG